MFEMLKGLSRKKPDESVDSILFIFNEATDKLKALVGRKEAEAKALQFTIEDMTVKLVDKEDELDAVNDEIARAHDVADRLNKLIGSA